MELMMSIAQLLVDNLKMSKTMTENLLADFSEQDMLFRPAKGANHATWQIGHLAMSTWGMVSGCDPTIESPVAKETRFEKKTSSVDDPAKFPKKAEVIKLFGDAMDAAAAWVGKLSEADMAKPSPERMQKFAPTVGNVALLLASHPMMHLGQYTVARRALGKPVLF
jgi:hypothetical protein